MNKEEIIKKSNEESDKLILKCLKICAVILLLINVVIVVSGRAGQLFFINIIANFVVLVPVVYYKRSSDRKYFVELSLINNIEQSQSNTSSIDNISEIIEQVNQSFEYIAKYANSINESAKALAMSE